MRTPRFRRLGAVAVLTTGAALLAGCASSTSGSGSPATPTTGSATTVDFDKTKAQGFLLTAADLGSGYSELPAGVLGQLGGMPGGKKKPADLKVEPQACVDAFTAQSALLSGDAGADKGAVSVLKKGTGLTDATVVGEALAPTVPGLDVLTDPDLLAQCQTITVTTSGKSATVTLTPVESKTYGDKTSAFKVVADASTGTSSLAVTSVVTLVQEGDKILALSVLQPSDTADAIEALAADTTATAYAKAADFLAS